jgi:hypothetical protein
MDAWWPVATRRPVPNTASPHPGEGQYLYQVAGPFTHAPLGWVLHVVVGNGSPYGTFVGAKSPKRRFSHLWIAKDGRVEQYGPFTHKSWANGTGNGDYLSCETEGFPEEPLTAAQVHRLAEFHVWTGFPDHIASHVGDVGVICHYQGGIDWGGHSCPDPAPGGQGPRSHQRDDILAAAKAIRTHTEDDLPLTDDDAAKVAKAVFNLNIGADGVNWGVALQRLYNRPAVTAQDIAAAIVAQFKTLPAGTATVDDATIAKVAQATATELATRLVR